MLRHSNRQHSHGSNNHVQCAQQQQQQQQQPGQRTPNSFTTTMLVATLTLIVFMLVLVMVGNPSNAPTSLNKSGGEAIGGNLKSRGTTKKPEEPTEARLETHTDASEDVVQAATQSSTPAATFPKRQPLAKPQKHEQHLAAEVEVGEDDADAPQRRRKVCELPQGAPPSLCGLQDAACVLTSSDTAPDGNSPPSKTCRKLRGFVETGHRHSVHDSSGILAAGWAHDVGYNPSWMTSAGGGIANDLELQCSPDLPFDESTLHEDIEEHEAAVLERKRLRKGDKRPCIDAFMVSNRDGKKNRAHSVMDLRADQPKSLSLMEKRWMCATSWLFWRWYSWDTGLERRESKTSFSGAIDRNTTLNGKDSDSAQSVLRALNPEVEFLFGRTKRREVDGEELKKKREGRLAGRIGQQPKRGQKRSSSSASRSLGIHASGSHQDDHRPHTLKLPSSSWLDEVPRGVFAAGHHPAIPGKPYVMKNFCVSPYGHLAGFGVHQKDPKTGESQYVHPFKGKNEARNIDIKDTAWQEYLSTVNDLKTKPERIIRTNPLSDLHITSASSRSSADQPQQRRRVIMVNIPSNPSNIGHALHRSVSLAAMMRELEAFFAKQEKERDIELAKYTEAPPSGEGEGDEENSGDADSDLKSKNNKKKKRPSSTPWHIIYVLPALDGEQLDLTKSALSFFTPRHLFAENITWSVTISGDVPVEKAAEYFEHIMPPQHGHQAATEATEFAQSVMRNYICFEEAFVWHNCYNCTGSDAGTSNNDKRRSVGRKSVEQKAFPLTTTDPWEWSVVGERSRRHRNLGLSFRDAMLNKCLGLSKKIDKKHAMDPQYQDGFVTIAMRTISRKFLNFSNLAERVESRVHELCSETSSSAAKDTTLTHDCNGQVQYVEPFRSSATALVTTIARSSALIGIHGSTLALSMFLGWPKPPVIEDPSEVDAATPAPETLSLPPRHVALVEFTLPWFQYGWYDGTSDAHMFGAQAVTLRPTGGDDPLAKVSNSTNNVLLHHHMFLLSEQSQHTGSSPLHVDVVDVSAKMWDTALTQAIHSLSEANNKHSQQPNDDVARVNGDDVHEESRDDHARHPQNTIGESANEKLHNNPYPAAAKFIEIQNTQVDDVSRAVWHAAFTDTYMKEQQQFQESSARLETTDECCLTTLMELYRRRQLAGDGATQENTQAMKILGGLLPEHVLSVLEIDGTCHVSKEAWGDVLFEQSKRTIIGEPPKVGERSAKETTFDDHRRENSAAGVWGGYGDVPHRPLSHLLGAYVGGRHDLRVAEGFDECDLKKNRLSNELPPDVQGALSATQQRNVKTAANQARMVGEKLSQPPDVVVFHAASPRTHAFVSQSTEQAGSHLDHALKLFYEKVSGVEVWRESPPTGGNTQKGTVKGPPPLVGGGDDSSARRVREAVRTIVDGKCANQCLWTRASSLIVRQEKKP